MLTIAKKLSVQNISERDDIDKFVDKITSKVTDYDMKIQFQTKVENRGDTLQVNKGSKDEDDDFLRT